MEILFNRRRCNFRVTVIRKSLAADDFNNDHRLDIVTANTGINNIGIMLGSEYGGFGTQTTYSTGDDSQPCSVAVGDFNNDGHMDIAVSNSYMHNVGVLLGIGNGMFQAQRTFFY